MKISLKLPLAFAAACGLVCAAGVFGIYRLNQAVDAFQNDVLHHVAGNKTGTAISNTFATGIQEWKNVLLRGKDPKDLDKYWIEIHSLENEGDQISRDAVASLFSEGIDPMVVIRWKDIFGVLEEAIDATEKAAQILEGIVIKNA